MELSEFLLARIDEDEAVASDGVERTYPGFEPWRLHNQLRQAFGQPGPVIASRARVLAECEAKRRLLRWIEFAEFSVDWGADFAEPLRILALPYVDHPDWREEWRDVRWND